VKTCNTYIREHKWVKFWSQKVDGRHVDVVRDILLKHILNEKRQKI
jgi:hypothetical protein